jgi:hypothetical protein
MRIEQRRIRGFGSGFHGASALAFALVALASAFGGCGGSDDASVGEAPGPAVATVPPRRPDGGTIDSGANGDAAAAPDGSVDAGGDEPAPSSSPTEPVIDSITPESSVRGVGVAITIAVSGAPAPSAVVWFDGQPVATSVVSGTSSSQLTVTLSPAQTMLSGFHPLWIETRVDAASVRSGVSYFHVAAAPGAPEVLEFSPDSGLPGDKARLVGFNLTAGPLMIADGAGHTVAAGAIGTLNAANVVLETVELTVPPGWKSGQLTVTGAGGSFLAKAFTVGRNLTQLPGVVATASSDYGEPWTTPRGSDNDLFTSWFTASGNCVTSAAVACTAVPWYTVTFPSAQVVGRIAVRGSREYSAGYDFLRARLEVLGAGGVVLWSGASDLPQPNRDLDVTLPAPIAGAVAVRFTSEKDESEDPGFGELEIFGPSE